LLDAVNPIVRNSVYGFRGYPDAAVKASAIARYPASVGCGSPFEQKKRAEEDGW
jgi:hypothetical protein